LRTLVVKHGVIALNQVLQSILRGPRWENSTTTFGFESMCSYDRKIVQKILVLFSLCQCELEGLKVGDCIPYAAKVSLEGCNVPDVYDSKGTVLLVLLQGEV